jgi:ATP-dependent Lhr-like helicase
MVVHSPFGGKVNAGWAIALAAEIADRAGVQPDMQVSDDGIMFRLPEGDSPVPFDLVQSLDATAVKERLIRHLDESPLFGALFRQNATRSLLMPVSIRGKRTPFWLQRRRAKDLLAIAREFPDFPVLLETYRDCLEDALDLAAIEQVLGDIRAGRIRVEHVESKVPSPVAQSLNYAFTNVYLYEWDTPRADRASHVLQLDRTALAELFKDPAFAGFLRQEAVDEVVAQVARTAPGYRARSPIELAELLEDSGDLNLQEIRQRCDGDAEAWLADLEARGLVTPVDIRAATPQRWIAAARVDDLQPLWTAGDPVVRSQALKRVVTGFLSAHGPSTTAEIAERYHVPASMVERTLLDLETEELLVSGKFTGEADALEWADPHLIATMQARTLGILRREVRPVSPLRYAGVVRRRQQISSPPPDAADDDRVRRVLRQLRGLRLPVRMWNHVVLPARLGHAYEQAVEAAFKSGDFVWLGAGDEAGRRLVTVFPRASGRLFLPASAVPRESADSLTPAGQRIWEFLRVEGTATSSDIRDALGDLSITDVRNALAETTGRGLVTANSWQVLAALDGTPAPGPEGSIYQGASGRRKGQRRESPARAVARAVREATSALPHDVRWSAAARFAILGAEPTDAERAAAHGDALADRYGVMTRYCLTTEGSPWPWGPIIASLGLLELRGKIRRGYFVAGLPGLQFAPASVVDELREAPGDKQDVVLVNAADPAFALDRAMFASIPDAPGLVAGMSRVPSSWVAFSGDLPVLLAEDDGRRILAEDSTVRQDAVRSAIELLRATVGSGGRRVSVETWNGAPVLGSPGKDILSSAGFRRDYPGMTFDEVQARVLSRKG